MAIKEDWYGDFILTDINNITLELYDDGVITHDVTAGVNNNDNNNNAAYEDSANEDNVTHE